jgi:hypothetical protein
MGGNDTAMILGIEISFVLVYPEKGFSFPGAVNDPVVYLVR